MGIYETFSARQKRLSGDIPDVYRYDHLDQKLKIQISKIIENAIGTENHFTSDCQKLFTFILKTIEREHGELDLSDSRGPCFALMYYFLNNTNVDQCLDVIELCFQMIDKAVRENIRGFEDDNPEIQYPDDAISELNERMRIASVGYQFAGGQLIKVNSQFLHSDVIQPLLLNMSAEPAFAGSNQEFLNAHEHYRNGNYKEAITDCAKSLESIMKAICDKRSWAYDAKATSKDLIAVCFNNHLIPPSLQTQFSSLRSLLETGTPVIRNKTSAHGQGTTVLQVPDFMVSYVLHLTATNLLFLVECEKALP